NFLHCLRARPRIESRTNEEETWIPQLIMSCENICYKSCIDEGSIKSAGSFVSTTEDVPDGCQCIGVFMIGLRNMVASPDSRQVAGSANLEPSLAFLRWLDSVDGWD